MASTLSINFLSKGWAHNLQIFASMIFRNIKIIFPQRPRPWSKYPCTKRCYLQRLEVVPVKWLLGSVGKRRCSPCRATVDAHIYSNNSTSSSRICVALIIDDHKTFHGTFLRTHTLTVFREPATSFVSPCNNFIINFRWRFIDQYLRKSNCGLNWLFLKAGNLLMNSSWLT